MPGTASILLPINDPQFAGIGDEKFISSIRQELCESLPQIQKEMNETITQKDWKTLREMIHRLLGSCAYCGAVGLKTVLEEMQSIVRQEPAQLKQINIDKFNEIIEATKQLLNESQNNFHFKKNSK